MTDINKNKNKYASLLLLAAMIFMGTGVISKAEAGLSLSPTETLSIPVENGSDDAEENIANGDMSLTSSDLEFIQDGSKQQKLGLRFPLTIPAGATILTAKIQFTVDETGSDPTSLTIHGQDINNAPTFSRSDFDISQRALTSESILWEPSAWTNKGEAGPNQQTPDLSVIVQASVDQPGWMQDNAIAFIISGSGKRVAESFNGTAAPVLQVEFSLDSPSLTSHLRITEVAVDTDTLTITGEAFDFNDILDLEVTLGDLSTGIGPGDITFECTSSTLPTDTRIVCDLSAGGLPEAGDYLLTVSTGADQSQSDEYDLTIGAADTASLMNLINGLQAQIDALQPAPYSIGDTGPGGGIIFHVTDGGLHGLEAAPADQVPAQWGCSGTDIGGIVNTNSFPPLADGPTGAEKTTAILNECDERPIAASVASDYIWPNGQTDGYLPDHEELNLLYQQAEVKSSAGYIIKTGVVGGFSSGFFWCSSEFGGTSNSAWIQLFSDGIQYAGNRSSAHKVRAVRAF